MSESSNSLSSPKLASLTKDYYKSSSNDNFNALGNGGKIETSSNDSTLKSDKPLILTEPLGFNTASGKKVSVSEESHATATTKFPKKFTF